MRLPVLPTILLCVLPLPVSAVAVTPDDLHEFQQRAAGILEANDVPGAGFALIRHGEVTWAGGIGRADIASGDPVLATTRFRTGSITKMFTALAVLRLVEEGRLSLDDVVTDIAPEVPIDNPWHATDPVRVAHLLEHTAGLDDMHFRHMNSDAPLPDSLAGVIGELEHELRVRWRPGLMHSYSNPGYAVAGYLVEKTAGMPLHRYIAEHVLAPLGIEDAAWGTTRGGMSAQGYTTRRGGGLRAVPPRRLLLYPAGDLSMSSRDLARVVQFFLRRGAPLVSDATITRMETPHTSRAARHGFMNGYALANYTSFSEGFRLHGHNGGLDGFIAEIAYSPEHGFGYAVVMNRVDAGALRLLGDLAVTFLASDIAAQEPGSLDTPGAIPAGIAGCYRKSNIRNEILHGLEWLLQVSCAHVEDDRVLLRHPVLPDLATFVPARENQLRPTDLAWPTLVFMHDSGMPDALQWSGSYFERSSRAGVAIPLVLALLALVLMSSTVVFLPVWLWRWRFGGLARAPALSTRAWPALASLLFGAMLLSALRLELSLLDSVNAVTVAILVSGCAFVLVSLYALFRVIRTWSAGIHPLARWHALLAALACCAVAFYLVYWRLVPLRLWAW